MFNRGNRKQPIFLDARDRRAFLRILIEELDTHGVEMLSGCEMGNHFHLVVVTPYGNLSAFMERLEGRFARYSNERHGNVGHLFQDRFRCVVIEHDIHLLIALCYVFLNPVSARLVARPEDYQWSTYASTVGLAPLPNYLSIKWLTTLFPSDSLQGSQRLLRKLMSEFNPVATYLEQGELALDPETARRVVRSYVGEQIQLALLPRVYRSMLRARLSDLVQAEMTEVLRVEAIYDAHVVHGYKLAEIARELRLRPATVCRIFRASVASRNESPRE